MKQTFVLASALLIAATLWTPATQAQQKGDNKKGALTGSLNVTTDRSDGTGETTVNYVDNDHRYKIRLNGSRILDLSVDGKKVPEQEFSNYDGLVKKILAQVEKDRAQAERDREQAAKDRAQAEKDRERAMRDRAQAEKDREQSMRDRAQVEKDRAQSVKDRQQAEKDRAQADRDREQSKKDRAQAELDRAQADKDRQQAAVDRKQAEEDRKLLDDMLDDLVKERLVESREALTSLELDDTKLVINGKAQPQNLHARFREKYLKGTHTRINYRNSGGTRNMSIN